MSSAFQPPIACSAFDGDDDDDDDERVEGGQSSTDSDNPTRTHSNSSNHRTMSSSASVRRSATSSHAQSAVTFLSTLRSVLHTGDHFFLFGAPPNAGRRPRRRERRTPIGQGARNENPDDNENVVSEIPRSMSWHRFIAS
ncbi:hypothetical protein FBUS_07575 [Fasciolopsis buskii]|uniref:Uncharacterized protein n=1 Tax=Fasciolopsis buskii TaxID=27845 RepID=A0A8E0S6E3_9TREM|nr:hypothetical protein FBUS_07575 [Fasciolopsis buski]